MNQQADGIEQIARPTRTAGERFSAPFVLFTGGKGGVGKTTLAANLAVELAREGRRVLLADLDLGLANIDVVLKLAPRNTVEDFLRGGSRLEDCIVSGPAGIDVLPASSGTPEMARPDADRRAELLAGLARVSRRYDVVIGDSGAGIGPDVLAFAAAAQHVLVVTTPEPTALTDAYGLIKALHSFGEERGIEIATPELVLNLVDGAAQADDVAARLRAVCERFLTRSPRLAGWMPRAAAISTSIARQVPFALGSPRSLENQCLRRLSARVQRWLTCAPAETASLKG
jgi:flagellar biosynthesis protein FlhG